MNSSCEWSRVFLVLIVLFGFLEGAPVVWAQTYGTAPMFGSAVQGQTGAWPAKLPLDTPGQK
jgi:hypothetical protein